MCDTETKDVKDLLRIEKIASEVGKNFGFTDVTAEITVLEALLIRWQRLASSRKWINFIVADYCTYMSDNTLKDYFYMIFSRMTGNLHVLSIETKNELVSEEFAQKVRPLMVSRLVDSGVIEDIDDVCVDEETGVHIYKGSGNFASMMMKIVVVPELNDEIFAEHIKEYKQKKQEYMER